MTDKERAVIEAAVEVYDSYNKRTSEVSAKRMVVLTNAIHALDAEQENDMGYKWLAMDNVGPLATMEKPEWAKGCWVGESIGFVGPSPSFLKPGQLWEECTADLNDNGRRVEEWRGKAWRLVADHSKPVAGGFDELNTQEEEAAWKNLQPTADDNPWIPIEQWEDDKDNYCASATFAVTCKKGRSFWPGLANQHFGELINVLDAGVEIVAYKPFGNLYIPSDEPKCEECFWFELIERKEENFRICIRCERGGSSPGMDGCVFKRKGE